MAAALRVFRRYRLASLLISSLVVLALLAALGTLSGVGPSKLAEIEQRLVGALPATSAPAGDALRPTRPLREGISPAEVLRSPDFLAGAVPGEFEPQQAIILGCNELVLFRPEVMVQVIAALKDSIHIIALVEDEQQIEMVRTRLAEHGLPMDSVQCVPATAREAWVRDYGPVFLRTRDGSAVILDAEYSKTQAIGDELSTTGLAHVLHLPRIAVPLTTSGGNMLHNGRGVCITSTNLVVENAKRNYDMKEIGSVLHRYYRTNMWVYVAPLIGEPTGHADMFITFTGPQTVVVGRYDPAQDSLNARILDDAANTLSHLMTDDGPFNVVRVQMPPHSDGAFRTYTNVVYANSTVLVPTYPEVCPDLDARALALYRDLLPGWKVVGVSAESLIHNNGAFHCIMLNVPAYEAPKPAPVP